MERLWRGGGCAACQYRESASAVEGPCRTGTARCRAGNAAKLNGHSLNGYDSDIGQDSIRRRASRVGGDVPECPDLGIRHRGGEAWAARQYGQLVPNRIGVAGGRGRLVGAA